MRRLWLLFVVMLLAPPAWASYTTVTVKGAPEVQGDGKLRVHVVITGDSGEASIERDLYVVSIEDLKVQRDEILARFNRAHTDAKTLKDGDPVAAPTKQPPPPPPTPTAEDVARQQWLADLFRYQRIQQLLVASGILKGDEKEVAELRDGLIAGYKPEYLTSLVP